MNGEAIESVIQLAKDYQALKNRILTAPSEPSDVYYYIDEDGIATKYVADPKPVVATVHSTAALLALATQAHYVPVVTTLESDVEAKQEIRELKERKAPLPQIFYSDAKAELVILDADKDHRTLRHVLPLPKHPVYSKLEGLLKTRKFTQRDLIKFLRAELNANVDPSVIEKFRNLKLSSTGEGSSVVEQGRNAVSRSLQQSIKAERGEGIPDEINVLTPVYDLDELRTQRLGVTVLVDCLPDEHGTPTFELTTVYNSLQAANYEALQSVAFELQKGAYPVIYGEVR